MNIDPHTGFAEVSGRSPRFVKWAIYFVVSIITMISSFQVKKGMAEFQEVPASTIFIVVVSVISFLATFIVVVMHILPITATMFVGTVVEGVFAGTLLLLSSLVVTLVAVASIALVGIEDATQTVQNANLYYFSWAGFVVCLLIVVDYAKVAFGIDPVGAIRGSGARTDLWAGILATCVVILGSCARTVRNDCNEANYRAYPSGYCQKTKYGIAHGVIGVVIALVILYLKVKGMGVSIKVEGGISIFMCLMSTSGVISLTAANGPGSAVGNLYYFTWGSFLVSTYLVFACFGAWSGIDANAEPTAQQDSTTVEQPNLTTVNNGDIQVETFDDGKI